MENIKKKFINKKPAMTLAEILVVVAIVAIIGGIFLAMPRKNVNQMDKAKYYVAYSTLFKLLEAQLADTGSLQINFPEGGVGNDKFGDSVEKYLNTAKSCNWGNQVEDDNCDSGNLVAFNKAYKNAILTNGMYLDWGSERNTPLLNNPLTSDDSADNLNVRDEDSHNITSRAVYIDIDGLNEGRSTEGQDVHFFRLYREATANDEIRVQPIIGRWVDGDYEVPGNIGSWIGFRVFQINNNGTTNVILNDLEYVSAYGCYDNHTRDGQPYCSSGGGQNACDRDDNTKLKCFIEPVRPLK